MKKIHYLCAIILLLFFFVSCAVPTTTSSQAISFFANPQLLQNSTWAIHVPGMGWRGFYFQEDAKSRTLSLSYSTNYWPNAREAVDQAKKLLVLVQLDTVNSFNDYDSLYYHDPIPAKSWVFRFNKDRSSGSFMIKQAGISPNHYSMLRIE